MGPGRSEPDAVARCQCRGCDDLVYQFQYLGRHGWWRSVHRITSPSAETIAKTSFLSDADREFYLTTPASKAQAFGLRLLGCCLRTNHAHLIAVPKFPNSVARTWRRAHSRYSQAFNKKYGRVGRLFFGAKQS